ncbi:phage associated protein [Ligilactobacillus murinus]|jgi:hypothetical protein|uniref:VRR-NUC domain-containing protein n=1 Tax=Ligilactobacillus murinus TaxID=1622 RepID=UPI0014345BD2|nr:VRR-NUC domain-containing protein [Ligilactobacillus murinus]BDI01436.1 phage associated protein [Ligilactobacillus murinus]GFI63638.1 hypothetical protein IMSAG117_01053 [Lactobacillaceae bacterium]
MRENKIESTFVTATKKRGGLCLKFVSPSMAGVPDRLVLLPGAHFAFVEMKAPGKHPRPLQINRINQLQHLGFLVYCCNNLEQIGGILDEIQSS